MATASCGASCEVPDGSAGRSFCWHGHEVYDGFSTVDSAVTCVRFTKALRKAQQQGTVQGPGDSLWHVVQGVAVLFCSARSLMFLFQTLGWFVSGTGSDPEVARVRLVGWSRRHSRVPCYDGIWLRARLTISGRLHNDLHLLPAGKPCNVSGNVCM